MALPGNTSTVMVLGTFLTPEGDPSTGSVTFTASSWLTNSGANVSIPNSSVTKSLGTAGDFSVTLPITDDPDITPLEFIYTVSEIVDGVSRNYNISIPGTVAAGGTVFLADLAPVAPAGPEYYSLASSLSIGTVTTLPQGSAATAEITGLAPNQTLNLGLPGGLPGAAATITVGTVTSGTAGGTPSVTNSGDSSAAVLDFVLIPGDTGPQGATGATGPQGPAATVEVGTVTTGTAGGTVSVTNSGTTGSAVLDFVIPRGDKGDKGDQGDPGAAASITVGTVTSVAFGGTASVTNTGTSGSAVLDFVLVTGPQGDLAGLSANQPLDYTSNTFSLLYGAGLGTATGGTLVADLSSATPQALGAAASGTATTISRADHVHALPSAADVGAVGTATTITAGTGLSGGGDLSASRTLDVDFSASTPAALGTAAAGTAVEAARGDHVHAMPTASDVGAVANSVFTDKGSLLAASAASTPANLPVGTDGHVLTADANETLGMKWAEPAGGLPTQTSQEGKLLTTNGTAASWVDPPTNRNLIINGAMQVAQRSTSVSSITSGGYYTADRWNLTVGTLGTWTQSVEADSPTGSGLSKSVKILCTTADASPAASDVLLIQQRLEGQDLQRIKKGSSAAEQLTVSFWVKSNVTGTYVCEFQDSDNTRHVAGTYSVSAVDTWEKKSITFPADTSGPFDNDNANSAALNFWLGAGTTFTSGTLASTWATTTSANRAVGQTNLAAATNNYWQITGVQLETGPVATPFEFEPYEATLRKCQRYYYLHASGASQAIGNGNYVTATTVQTFIHYPVTMRVAPSLVVASGSGYYRITSDGLDDDFNSLLIQFPTPTTARLYNNTEISGTAYRPGNMYTNNAAASIALSAEL